MRRLSSGCCWSAVRCSRAGRSPFLPVETLLCLAASFLVNHRHFGGGTAHRAPEPVPSLARLFSRPPSSVLAKMANLDGSRSHGARWDVLAGAKLRMTRPAFRDLPIAAARDTCQRHRARTPAGVSEPGARRRTDLAGPRRA